MLVLAVSFDPRLVSVPKIAVKALEPRRFVALKINVVPQVQLALVLLVAIGVRTLMLPSF